MLSSKSSKVLIATFSPWKNNIRLTINGNLEPMRDFFVPKTKKTVIIDQPYPGSEFVMPRLEVYEAGNLKKIRRSVVFTYILYPFLLLFNKSGTNIFFKIRDFGSVIDWSILNPEKYDFFIGFEAINAIAGVLLRSFGRVGKVVYYVSDYSPNRYKQKWFNSLYLWLDRFAAIHSDCIWDVSKAMQPARIKAGLDPRKSATVIHVPNALYPSQIKFASLNKIKRYSLVFMGTLGVENGPDIAVEALPIVLRKFPKTILHIIGGGKEDVDRLQKLTEKLKLKERVVFHGFIANREKVSEAIRIFYVALAPYPFIEGSPRLYGDATKIRAYLAAGLPVITTHIPPLGKEAAEKGAAILVGDNSEAFAKAIIQVFSSRNLYLRLRKNAIRFAKNNTWENEFAKAFEDMERIAQNL